MTTKQIDSHITNAIQRASNYPYIIKVGVFGSYARGEHTPDSDIDILFDYNSNDDDSFLDDIDNYFEDLENSLGKIDFVSLRGVLDCKSECIKQSILNDVIWIYEKNSHADEL